MATNKRRNRKPVVVESPDEKGEQVCKQLVTHDLRLSTEELVHLRDLFSVLLPPDGSRTLSQSLAISEKRQMVEAKLWDKVVKLLEKADVPMGDDAPDYAVALVSVPTLAVVPINTTREVDTEEP